MTQPTHTHRERGGRYYEVAQHQGTESLDGHWLVIYQDLDKGIQSATTQADWLASWRELAPDDCQLCMGTGHDHIKGNKDKPCGHCYGLGKVQESGDAPAEMWDLATVAIAIIKRQQDELLNLRRIASNPAVQALLDQDRQQAVEDSVARDEQRWRDGRGHGPGGQRYTGD